MSGADYLTAYLRALQRRELDRERAGAVRDYAERLNEVAMTRADAHHPLADPAVFRNHLLAYLKR